LIHKIIIDTLNKKKKIEKYIYLNYNSIKMSEPFEKYIDELKKVLDISYFNCKNLKIIIKKEEKLLLHLRCEDHSNTKIVYCGIEPFLDGIKTINNDEDIDEDDFIELKKEFSSLVEKKQIESTKQDYIYLLIIFDVQELFHNEQLENEDIPEEIEENEEIEKPLMIGIDDFGWNITIIDTDKNEILFSTSKYLSK
jgi:hypothetical protein